MLKYLIIPLSDDSVSFCHYDRKRHSKAMIPLDVLRDAVLWSMKENLTIQLLYPDWVIPAEYKELIDTIDHTDIVGGSCEDIQLVDSSGVIVLDSRSEVEKHLFSASKSYVIRTLKNELFKQSGLLGNVLSQVSRLVLIITDIDKFSKADFKEYELLLDSLIPIVRNEYVNGHVVQFNLLTDLIFLDSMNNCNAGCENITLAPDSRFYICPAFYNDGSECIGDLDKGLDIRNSQLYNLKYAPICSRCDAYQCRRCVWMNRNTTLEINTPSREQCIVAHIERKASKKLLDKIREVGVFMPDKEIPFIEYIDPLELFIKS